MFEFPAFDSVTDTGVLLPTATFPKLMLLGLAERTPAVGELDAVLLYPVQPERPAMAKVIKTKNVARSLEHAQ